METHFEGSRGSDNHDKPHQRQYDEQNPDVVNHDDNKDPDDKNPNELASKLLDHPEEVDSDINTRFEENAGSTKSLTIDESANTDPNEVSDKPSFKRDSNQ